MDRFSDAELTSARTEAADVAVDERVLEWWHQLPAEVQEFLLARIEEAETGEMPMPPMRLAPPPSI